MKALVIGRGSMGKRRIRDLSSLGVDVESWDKTDGGPNPMDVCPTGPDFPWQMVCLCTPPLTKTHDVRRLIPAFTEADVESFFEVGVYYPSCSMRFHPQFVRIAPVVRYFGRPLAYTHHTGQHLADWHPGADLSSYYAARKATGACREMIPFELCWLTALFGPVTSARGIFGRSGTIAGAECDDVYQVVVEHAGIGDGPVLGHLLIDALSRPARRHTVVVASGGTFEWDWKPDESMYLAEMRAFIASVKGEQPWPYSASDEAANLEVLHTIERSG